MNLNNFVSTVPSEIALGGIYVPPSIGRRIDWLNTNIAHSTLTEQIALASLFLWYRLWSSWLWLLFTQCSLAHFFIPS